MRSRSALLIAIVIASFLRATSAYCEVTREYLLKAAVIEKLPLFFDVNQSVKLTSTANAPFVICILGTNPFERTIEKLSAAEGGIRPTVVRLISEPRERDGCTLLYLARSEQSQLESQMKAFSGPNIVTVSDIAGFAEAGGMVELRIDNSRVRFIINNRAAQSAGIRFFSQLLALAERII